jgi:hypothetical protein
MAEKDCAIKKEDAVGKSIDFVFGYITAAAIVSLLCYPFAI